MEPSTNRPPLKKTVSRPFWFWVFVGDLDPSPAVYDSEKVYIRAINLYHVRVISTPILFAMILFAPFDLVYLKDSPVHLHKLTMWRITFTSILLLGWLWGRFAVEPKGFSLIKVTFVIVVLSFTGCVMGVGIGPFQEPWISVFLMAPMCTIFLTMGFWTRLLTTCIIVIFGFLGIALAGPTYIHDPFFYTFVGYQASSIGLSVVSGHFFSTASMQRYIHSVELKARQELLRVRVEERTEKARRAIQLLESSKNEVRKNVAYGLQNQLGHLIAVHNISLHKFKARFEDEPGLVQTAEVFLEQLQDIEKGAQHVVMESQAYDSGNVEASYLIKSFLASRKQTLEMEMDWIVEPEDFLLPARVAYVLSRILQEAVTNTIKHAQATKIEVALLQTEKELSFSIRDNGVGFDPLKPTSRLGLKGIRERIRNIGGHFQVKSSHGQGTELLFSLERDFKEGEPYEYTTPELDAFAEKESPTVKSESSPS